MPVAHGGVGDEQLLLLLHPVGHGLRAFLLQQVARAHLRRGAGQWRAGLFEVFARAGAVLGFGVPVDGDVGDIGQNLGAAVTTPRKDEQLGCLVDEFGGVFIAEKRRVLQQVFDKGDIGADAANPELAQRAIHSGNRRLWGLRVRRHFDQQAVIKARDDAARIGGSAIKANTHARRFAKGGDAAIIGDKVVLRVLGRDARLQSVAVQVNLVL